jgi:hypothetical protein
LSAVPGAPCPLGKRRSHPPLARPGDPGSWDHRSGKPAYLIRDVRPAPPRPTRDRSGGAQGTSCRCRHPPELPLGLPLPGRYVPLTELPAHRATKGRGTRNRGLLDVPGHSASQAVHGRRHLADATLGEVCEPVGTRYLAANRRGRVVRDPADLSRDTTRRLTRGRRDRLKPSPDIRFTDPCPSLRDCQRAAGPRKTVDRKPTNFPDHTKGMARSRRAAARRSIRRAPRRRKVRDLPRDRLTGPLPAHLSQVRVGRRESGRRPSRVRRRAACRR